MLSAKHRLRRRADFVRTVRAGRRAQRPALVGHLLAGPVVSATSVDGSIGGPGTDVPVRVGFVVSRAVGGAVQRNRVRRRLRHLMRDRIAALPAGSALVVRAQPAARDLPAAALAADLDGVLGRLARSGRTRGSSR